MQGPRSVISRLDALTWVDVSKPFIMFPDGCEHCQSVAHSSFTALCPWYSMGHYRAST